MDLHFSAKKALKRTWIRATGGYKCSCCGASLPIHWSDIHTEVNGKRLMISSYSKDLICASCLCDKITDYFFESKVVTSGDDYYVAGFVGVTIGNCDWYDVRTEVIDGIMKIRNPAAKKLDLDIRFGSGWWNGHFASLEVFQEGLLHNPKLRYTTSIFTSKKINGKYETFMVDRNGMKIHVDRI
jgi:hypothetical protein